MKAALSQLKFYSKKRELSTSRFKSSELVNFAYIKAEAALKDAEELLKGYNLDFESLQPYWDYDSTVNDSIENPNQIDAALFAADLSQLLVLLAKDNLKLVHIAINGIKALKRIIFEIQKNNENNISFRLELPCIIEAAKNSLENIMLKKEISQDIVNKYIKNRFSDIEKGLGVICKHTQEFEQTQNFKNKIKQ